MKRIIILIFSIVLSTTGLLAQSSVERVLQEVEQNNTTLSALRLRVEAEKAGNKTGIYLQNPEVEFNYLFGSPTTIGNRTDVRVTQGFDFPTAYSYKNQISDLKNEQVALEYEKQRKTILLETRKVCNELIWLNALLSEYSQRIENANHLVNLYKSKFEKGESNVLDYNKAKLGLLDVSKKAESLKISRNEKLAELIRLNGGKTISFDDTIFPVIPVPADFDNWYAQAEQNNPVLQWLKLETEVSRKNEKLNSALSLPKFQAGYMSEKEVEQQFQGITVGLAIPLWENKNKVKQARATTDASEAVVLDNKVWFYNHLKALHAKAVQLQNSLEDYHRELQSCNNTELAGKALEAGEISMIDYIMELTVYYESVNNMHEIEKELNQTLAELHQFM